jgi:predicted nuclease of predicted toxin-antitoxin system
VKFLLDENFPKSVAWALKEKGHDVLDLRSVGLLGASDTVVAWMAMNEGAMILTTDRDFFRSFPNVYAEHSGVVVNARRQPNREAITQRLEWFRANVCEGHCKNCVFPLRDSTWLAKPSVS